ncbi:MAG: SIS domain-containing protein [Anaerolineaceae bacterium]|nr:SIS domain-containing protein [Anaerolineaceae bacterium]
MSTIIHDFRETINGLFAQIEQEQTAFEKAAKVIADAFEADRMVHVIGPGGHSNMGVEEILWRAGGLAIWDAILDPGTNLIHGAKRSNIVERTPGYAKAVLDAYHVGAKPGEVMVIINAYGINSMTIDTVLECRKRGVTTIAVTSDSFAKIVPQGHQSRHPSGKNLFEEADIYINNHLPVGDAVIAIEGYDQKVGSTSTFCNCFCMNCLSASVVQEFVKREIEPPVFVSANMPGGDEHNKALEEKYGKLVKHLL